MSGTTAMTWLSARIQDDNEISHKEGTNLELNGGHQNDDAADHDDEADTRFHSVRDVGAETYVF